MKMILKLLIVCVLCIVTVGILYVVGILIYASITEFKPAQIEELTTAKTSVQTIPTGKELSLLSWNIGYSGLGKEMDFFYEGGDMVQPKELQNNEYLKGIIDFASQNDSIDFLLFQEVDFDSKRSYYTNQSDLLHSILTNYYKIQTSIQRGFRSGFFLAIGIFISDLTALILAYFGATQFLGHDPRENFLFSIIGGSFRFLARKG